MRTGKSEAIYLDLSEKAIKKVIAIQQRVAKKIKEDVVTLAPKDTGAYAQSIKVGKTTRKNGVIKTKVYTDYLTPTSDPKWSKVPLGCLLEWGTGVKGFETNTFKHGFPYRMTSWTYYNEKYGKWITTKGMIARPHFQPALLKNRPYYLSEMNKVTQEM